MPCEHSLSLLRAPRALQEPTFQLLTTDEVKKPFSQPLPLDSAQQQLSSIPLAMFYPGMLAFVALSANVGMAIGSAVPGERPGAAWRAAEGAGACVGSCKSNPQL